MTNPEVVEFVLAIILALARTGVVILICREHFAIEPISTARLVYRAVIGAVAVIVFLPVALSFSQ